MNKPSATIIMQTVTTTYRSSRVIVLKGTALLIGMLFAGHIQAATRHVVESGETLSGIAVRYDVSQTALIDTNGLLATYIQVGQVLEIPDKEKNHNIYKIKVGDSLNSVSKKYSIDLGELAAANNLSPQSGLLIDSTLIIPNRGKRKNTNSVTVTHTANVSEQGNNTNSNKNKPAKVVKVKQAVVTRNNQGSQHRIQYGETLLKIANIHQVNIQSLAQVNNMNLNDTLYFGRYLTIPTDVYTQTTTNTSKKIARKMTAVPSKYIVQSGDTLMGVANKFNTDFVTIAKLSNINYYDHLTIGQTLVLPTDKPVTISN